MSQENVEIARRGYAAFNDGDMAGALDMFDPDIEWSASDVFFDTPVTYSGREEWRTRFLPDLMEIFEAYRAEPEELIDLGEQVLAIVRLEGIGRRSGAEVIARVGHVATFRNRKMVRFVEYAEVAEALEAGGPRE